jgi:hypothetical protein
VLELYRKHRPTRTDGIAGQAEALKILRKLDQFRTPCCLKVLAGAAKRPWPESWPSGSDATRTPQPRFLRGQLRGGGFRHRHGPGNPDEHVGCGHEWRGQVWILDEVQSLSRAKFAQEAMLKILEDGQDHVWFFLATTDPKKILLTIRNRCTQIKLTSIPDKDLSELVKRVAAAEGAKLSTDLIEKIVEASDGSARAALVNLEKVIKIEGDADQIKAIGRVGGEAAAFDLVKAILSWKGPPDWKAASRFSNPSRRRTRRASG